MSNETSWNDMKNAPKDGTPILVYYDHDGDPYYIENTVGSRLTRYGTHAEYKHLAGKGYAIVKWVDSWQELNEWNGAYYTMPGWWFTAYDDDELCAVSPVCWMNLPNIPNHIQTLHMYKKDKDGTQYYDKIINSEENANQINKMLENGYSINKVENTF